MSRIDRSTESLNAAFQDQIDLLTLNCENYDHGHKVANKIIALNIRVFLYDKSRSQSLFSQKFRGAL